MRSTINSYLEDYVRRGGETAFAHRRGLRLVRWSYRRVAETAYGFARELEARGVGKGERVLLWAANGPERVAAFFGCVLRGAVVGGRRGCLWTGERAGFRRAGAGADGRAARALQRGDGGAGSDAGAAG